jgi:putative hydrolase of the HAD superfamily
MAIKNLILDLGAVVLNLDQDKTLRAFKRLGSDLDEVHMTSSLFTDFETGKINADYFVQSLFTLLKGEASKEKIVAAWNAMLLDLPPHRIDMLMELKKKYRLFLLSNTNALHIVEVSRALKKVSDVALGTYFQQVFLSHEIGKRKPHPETFLWTCNQMGFAPKDVLFIDDSPQHIEGAQAAGLQTYFYQSDTDFYAFFS